MECQRADRDADVVRIPFFQVEREAENVTETTELLMSRAKAKAGDLKISAYQCYPGAQFICLCYTIVQLQLF